ncbi:hypothetical protein C8J56DRAFT_833576 [Mycena floridula]|nr:hypothetical protein C8J56DRAFT_833576 [Mycena floridula]
MALLLLLALVASPVFGIWPFPPKRFTGNSLVDAGSMGLIADRVVAFGDFNGDQFLDILTLDSDKKTLSVFLWHHEAFSFQKSSSFQHSDIVQNVVPGDFTHSGKLDLLVMGQASLSQLDMWLYPALPGGGFASDRPLPMSPSSVAQPIPIDLNGDMRIDLLGADPTSKSLQVWNNVWSPGTPNQLFNITAPPFTSLPQCTLANPHSNAVVDLDGDCLADIFLICTDASGKKSYQIWINHKLSGFGLALKGDLPDGVGAISFADMDRDGTIDLVFATCTSVSSSTGFGENCAINIAYNKQLPLCAPRDSSTACRPPDDLCTPDRGFTFDLTNDRDNDAFVSVPLADLFPGSTPSLLMLDTTTTPPLPVALKLGDANLDGFPDILIITAPSSSQRGGGTPKLLFNAPCSGYGDKGHSGNGPIAGCVGLNSKRGWQVIKKDVESLEAVTDAVSVSFLDMDEDGTMDIMIQRSHANGDGGKIQFVANNVYYDAFFLKAIVLNGACDNGWCYPPNDSERYRPLGVSYSGASYKYTVLDTTNHRAAAQVAQLPVTSYQALLTPYAFFGLGRTNNYLENLFVGSTIYSGTRANATDTIMQSQDLSREHYINIEGVIPNSKVVISPPSMPDRIDSGLRNDVPLDKRRWKRELFLRPGAWIPWVTLTVVVGTVLLAVIVLVLHLSEKREDELERRRASHHINFDAL